MPKDSDDIEIIEMLHIQMILARSRELFVDRSQIQGPSIVITAAIPCSSLIMQPSDVVEDVFQSDMKSRRAGR